MIHLQEKSPSVLFSEVLRFTHLNIAGVMSCPVIRVIDHIRLEEKFLSTVFLAKNSNPRTLAATVSLVSCPAQLSGLLITSTCKRNLRQCLSSKVLQVRFTHPDISSVMSCPVIRLIDHIRLQEKLCQLFLAKNSNSRTLAATISLVSCPAQLSGLLITSTCKRNLRQCLSSKVLRVRFSHPDISGVMSCPVVRLIDHIRLQEKAPSVSF
jgi:hypothetical protein